MTTPVVIHFDGGTRPDNPGPSAIGYILETDDWTEEGSAHIGESINNQTEYRALIRGLELASEKGCTEVEARGDSQLIVRQVTGDWQTKKQHLRELRNRARDLAEEFETFEIVWVNREENLRADELVDREFDD